MGHIKYIFKIILLIQLLTCVLASYGHPDAETIDFGSPTQPSRDQLIIEAAIKRGMDGEAVAELLRTKKPVVKTTTTPGGTTKTTTYKLEPDGSISSKSIIQHRNRYVYKSGNIPDSIPIDELKNSPTGTVTRTFTDSDGNKVTQTIAVNNPKSTTDDLSDDWFKKPFPSWPEEASSAPSSSTVQRTITRTFTGPSGEKRTVHQWNSDPLFSEPDTFNRRTITRTHSSWPSFDYPSFSQPWDATDPKGLDGWEVVKDSELETTTKKKLESWTPKTWDWPEFPTTRTTVKTKEPEETTPKPNRPSLEDFLRKQYGPSTQRASTPPRTTTRYQANTPKLLATTTATPTTRATTTTNKPKIIKIEDLPVMEILHNGEPANEAILMSLPPHLRPRTQTDQILKIEHKHPIDEDIEVYTPKVETNIRTYSKTLIGPEKPSIKDLDPQMQEVLRKAGISPDDITNIEGDTITKTRQEPDGHFITTTYKVNTVPPSQIEPIPARHPYKPPQSPKHSYSSYRPIIPSLTPLQSATPHSSSISEFLAKLGLTKYDITSRNGHYTKTFIDDNGDVLTAKFVLSSPKGGVESEDKLQANPHK